MPNVSPCIDLSAFDPKNMSFIGIFASLMLAQARLNAAIRASIIAAPGFSAVLRRLHAARIETAAVEPESGDPSASPMQPLGERLPRGAGTVRALINWSAVPVGAGTLLSMFPDAPVFEAGGAATVGQDSALVEQLAALADARSGDVLILVKAWEPPLMEFVDFVKALRTKISAESAEIVVLPVGLEPAVAGLGRATPAQFKLWREKLARVGDPSLRVAADRQEVVA